MKSFRILAVGLMALSGATCASLSAAGSTYYLNDNLATTVGIADAAGEIAALEADAFGAPMAAGHAPSRYTGKPYDEDMGAYVFPFRNYRPEEARWMSADPSGFPDGVNGCYYAPNSSQLDPWGLVSVPLSLGPVSFTISYTEADRKAGKTYVEATTFAQGSGWRNTTNGAITVNYSITGEFEINATVVGTGVVGKGSISTNAEFHVEAGYELSLDAVAQAGFFGLGTPTARFWGFQPKYTKIPKHEE